MLAELAVRVFLGGAFADLPFIERDTAGNPWHCGWPWSLLLTRGDMAEAWRLLLHLAVLADLCLVALLNWTVAS